MANRYNSDVNPAKGEKNSKKDASQPSGAAKPGNPKSFSAPSHARGGAPSGKGGKGLPCPSFEEYKHNEPSAPLPKGGK